MRKWTGQQPKAQCRPFLPTVLLYNMFARWGLKGDSQHIEPPIPVTRKTSHRAEAGSFGTRAGTGIDPLVVGLWAGRKELLNGGSSGQSVWGLERDTKPWPRPNCHGCIPGHPCWILVVTGFTPSKGEKKQRFSEVMTCK